MTNKTFKQIAKYIEENGSINAVQSKFFSRTRCSDNYRVEIGGEWYKVSTASWNKLWHEFTSKRVEVEEINSFRHITYVFTA